RRPRSRRRAEERARRCRLRGDQGDAGRLSAGPASCARPSPRRRTSLDSAVPPTAPTAMRPSMLVVPLLAAALSLAACQHVRPGDAPAADAIATGAASSQAPANASPPDDNLNAVLWVQASAEYRATTETIYRAAADRL